MVVSLVPLSPLSPKKRRLSLDGSPPASPTNASTKKKKAIRKLRPSFANAPDALLSSLRTSSDPAASTSQSNSSAASSSSLASLLANVDPRIREQRNSLPIAAGKDAILQAIRDHDTVVVLGETGSGKTTQIPQYLFEAGFAHDHIIGVTQPRRVAATSLARRVAAEMGCPDPASDPVKGTKPSSRLVGYSIRFDDRTSKHTRIKFMTDGMVLREMIGDGNSNSNSNSNNDKEKGKAKEQPQPHLSSSLLSRYSVLIIDEAHERTLRTDMVLGLAKRIQRERKLLRANWIRSGKPAAEHEPTELKIVVMSATLDAKSFADFFSSPSKALASASTAQNRAGRHSSGQDDGETQDSSPPETRKSDVPILYVKGRQHTVTTFHTEEPSQEWADAALRTVLQIHVSRPPGDILVFMTGQEEIESLAKSLEVYASQLPQWAEHEGKPAPLGLLVAPLYAALGPSASVKVFAPTPPHTRKVVLATNIAETSITIPGIVYVIDCGLAKEKVYTPQTSVESLQTQEISQSAARQRAGRAGRERSGECYRLYTQDAFRRLSLVATPEILRTDLAGAVLQLCAMGQDPYHFDWMDAPDGLGLRDAVIHLVQLGALTVQTNGLALTERGRRMALLPVAPAYARALLAAAERGPTVCRQVRDVIAVLSADRGVLHDPTDPEKRDEATRAKSTFAHPSGDHGTMLNVLYAYLDQARLGRDQLRAWCTNYWVHERSIKNVLHIRRQLAQLCKQQGLVCDDDAPKPAAAAAATGTGTGTGDEGSEESENEDTDGLFVTRKSDVSTLSMNERGAGPQDDYAEMRQCMLAGRLQNAALRTPEGLWKRVAGGAPFKLHPSSVLHGAQRVGAGSGVQRKLEAILFEELVFTSQNFARTVSRIEPAWLQEAAAACTSTSGLQ